MRSKTRIFKQIELNTTSRVDKLRFRFLLNWRHPTFSLFSPIFGTKLKTATCHSYPSTFKYTSHQAIMASKSTESALPTPPRSIQLTTVLTSPSHLSTRAVILLTPLPSESFFVRSVLQSGQFTTSTKATLPMKLKYFVDSKNLTSTIF